MSERGARSSHDLERAESLHPSALGAIETLEAGIRSHTVTWQLSTNYFNFAVSETGLLCDQFQKKTGGRQRGFVAEPDLRGKLFPYASRSFAHGLELTSLILDGKVVSND